MKQVNIGVVGFGGIAKIHAIACYAMQVVYKDLPFRPNLIKAYRREQPKEKGVFNEIVTSLEKLLQDPEIDLVDICTPNYLHFEQVKKALEYGKAVYCEKPLALSYVEAKVLAELAADKNVINQVALMYRFMPAVAMAREFIATGELGEIVHFRFALYHKGYLNERPLGWREQKKFAGGGALMDLGIHMADLVRFMLGDIHSVRSEFYTYTQERFLNGKAGATGKIDVDEYAKVEIKLKNASLGTIECSRISSNLHEDTVIGIYGTKGSIKITGDEPLYPTIHRHIENRSCIGDMESNNLFTAFCRKIYPTKKTTLGTQVDMHQTSLYNIFLNMVQERTVYQETPTFYEAAQSQKIIEMAYLSELKNNRWILWDEVE